VPFVQHAIRASGVDCHPAQTDTFPTHSVRTAAIAASRLVSVSTYVECGTTAALSNHHVLGVVCTLLIRIGLCDNRQPWM